MLTINLEKKLIAANQKSLAARRRHIQFAQRMDAETKKLVAEAKGSPTTTGFDALRVLGMDYSHHPAWLAQRVLHDLSDLPQDRVFSEDAVKKICLQYGLRCLPSNLYKGELDEGIPGAIAEAARILNRDPSSLSYCIAAPKQAFRLQDRPAPDPLLFVKLNHSHYYLAHKWGNDISIFRRISVFFRRWLFFPVVPLLIAPAAVYGAKWGFTTEGGLPASVGVFSCILGLFGFIASIVLRFDDEERIIDKPDNWNSPFESRS